MNQKVITLWGDENAFRPYGLSAYVALMEKGLPFTFRRLILSRREHLSPDWVGYTAMRRVPLLEIEGFILSKSPAIAE